jgi:hypothetical protein
MLPPARFHHNTTFAFLLIPAVNAAGILLKKTAVSPYDVAALIKIPATRQPGLPGGIF